VNSPALDQISGYTPNALLHALDDASPAESFQPPYVSLDEPLRIAV
jgi:hypothetical protein